MYNDWGYNEIATRILWKTYSMIIHNNILLKECAYYGPMLILDTEKDNFTLNDLKNLKILCMTITEETAEKIRWKLFEPLRDLLSL